MAGRKAAKQAPAKLEEDDDTEGWDDAVVDADSKEEADLRMRDWRDVERYREMKELRRLVDDDYGLEEIFRIPARPRAEPGAGKKLPKPAPGGAKGASKVPPPAPAKHAKPAKGHAPAHAHAAAHAKHAPRKPAPPAKLKAKAKRK